MTVWDDLETPLDEAPLFPVQEPDGRKELSELERQVMFRRYAKDLAPTVIAYATPNAGKRGFEAQRTAKLEGLMAGVFDMTCAWDISVSTATDAPVSVCWIEFKGYDGNGRPGKLSRAQIDWGNAMHRRGHKVACFFSGKSAFDWLASLGAPVRGRIAV